MASRSTGSSPSAIAGSPSVTRSTNRICTGSSGTRRASTEARNMTQISPELVVSRERTKRRTLSQIRRPSPLAATMVAKDQG